MDGIIGLRPRLFNLRIEREITWAQQPLYKISYLDIRDIRLNHTLLRQPNLSPLSDLVRSLWSVLFGTVCMSPSLVVCSYFSLYKVFIEAFLPSTDSKYPAISPGTTFDAVL